MLDTKTQLHGYGRSSIEALATYGVPSFTNVKSLHLVAFYLDDRGGPSREGKDTKWYFDVLCNVIMNLESLENFAMIRCGVNDEQCTLIAKACFQSRRVNVLNLEGNSVTEAGAKELGTLVHLSKELKGLCLRNNNIRDNGLNYILNGIQDNHHYGLQKLDVRKNNVTKAQVKALQKKIVSNEWPLFICELKIDSKLRPSNWNAKVNPQLQRNVECRKTLHKVHAIPGGVKHEILPEVLGMVQKLSPLPDHIYGIICRNIDTICLAHPKATDTKVRKRRTSRASTIRGKRTKTNK
jgi:hypothetical protein